MNPTEEIAPARSGILLRPLVASDLKSVVNVHLAAFRSAAMSLLGADVVEKYYEWHLHGPHAVACIAATLDGELAGFSVVVSGAKLKDFIRLNVLGLLWSIVRHPTVFKHAGFPGRLSQGIRSMWEAREVKAGTARLLVIAVEPKYQRLGVGSSLLAASEMAAKKVGTEEIRLTVHLDNIGARTFYFRNGWDPSGSGMELRKSLQLGAKDPPHSHGLPLTH